MPVSWETNIIPTPEKKERSVLEVGSIDEYRHDTNDAKEHPGWRL